jgi:hypothetical protein
MKLVACAFAFALAACGSKQEPPPKEPDHTPAVQDTRSPLEKRRDAACDVVGKRVSACAVEDAKRDLAAGKVTKEQFDQNTAPQIVAKNAEKYSDKCKDKRDYSSRQIRVLEKCPTYETQCEPFLRCLDNVHPDQASGK